MAAFIYLATPCYGGMVNLYYMQSVLALKEALAARGVGLHVELVGGDALISRARSRLAQRFLAHPQATHLLFVDADIAFEPANVLRLLEADKAVCGGVYPTKKVDWERARAAALAGVDDLQAASMNYVLRFLPTPDRSIAVDDGFAQVSYVGTGLMLIRRDAMQRLVDAHPELRAKMGDMGGADQPDAVMVFETMIEPETGEYLSEDYAFCRRWRDLGGEIWADVQSRLGHIGHATYTGSVMQVLQPQPPSRGG